MSTLVRQRDLSPDDLAVMSGRRIPIHEPDEEAVQRSLAIHEPPSTRHRGPVSISQIVTTVNRRPVHGTV